MTDSRNTRNTRNTTLAKAGRTHEARARKVLTANEFFFYKHEGSSHDPQVETLEQGRIRGARELAKAEAFAKGQKYEFEWDWDTDADLSWMTDEERQREHEVTCCRIFNPCEEYARAGKYATLGALCGIVDADANYRRVVEAELALEAMHEYDREVEVLDAH